MGDNASTNGARKSLGDQWENLLDMTEETARNLKASSPSKNKKDSERRLRVDRLVGESPVERRRRSIVARLRKLGKYNVEEESDDGEQD